MSKRDQAAALIVACAAAGVFALHASGSEPETLGPDPYVSGRVVVTGEVVRVEDDRFELRTDLGRVFVVETGGLDLAPRDDRGDLALDEGERVEVAGTSGAPLIEVNMIAATDLRAR